MLKLSSYIGLAVASMVALSAAPATAVSFRASYDFGGPTTDGDVFSFDFDGIEDGNSIRNVDNLSNFVFGNREIFDPNILPAGPIVVVNNELSRNGLLNNFVAVGTGGEDLLIFNDSTALLRDRFFGSALIQIESFDEARWSVVSTSATPIPTPALLPGVIGMSFAVLRKRNSIQSDDA